MRRVLSIFAIIILMSSCNDEGTATDRKLDSLQLELDTLGQKIDTTLDKAWDSTKVKAKILKEKVKDKLEDINDSNSKDSIK
jgi:ElaB/YqjD/DUF883 family membrane-anchored ribosome-binding protein